MQAEKYKILVNMHACKDGTQMHTSTDAHTHKHTRKDAVETKAAGLQ